MLGNVYNYEVRKVETIKNLCLMLVFDFFFNFCNNILKN